MADNAPLLKVQADRRDVKKGSRMMPLLMLAASVVGFVAFGVYVEGDEPELQVRTFEDAAAARRALGSGSSTPVPPGARPNLYVVARVPGDPDLLFRIFDRDSTQRAQRLTSEGIDETDQSVDYGVLYELMDLLEPYWDEPEIPPSVQEEVRDKVLWLAGYTFDVADWQTEPLYQVKRLADELAVHAPLILQTQIKKLWVVLLYSLVPGLFGLIYRRSFWTWFGRAFLMLFVVNLGFETYDVGSVAPSDGNMEWVEGLLKFSEEIVVLLLIAFRLRRETVSAINRSDQWRAIALGVLLFVLAIAGVYFLHQNFFWRSLEGGVLLMALAYVLVTQIKLQPQPTNARNIVLCLDGTWNEPGQKDFDKEVKTNVLKLFEMCKGGAPRETYNASLCKVYPGTEDGAPRDRKSARRQIALYYQGVGNKVDNSPVGQVFGGAFGLGADAIVERAYLDVVKEYQPGDRIFIFGFSRGAAIARLVAGAIGRRGIPKTLWTLRVLGRHWLVWKSRQALDVKVEVLGCWDTVGAFGISKNVLGIPFQRINLLHDLSVSLAVRRAYHMVAIDETRDSFVPTLMLPDPTDPGRIVEVWFSGNHSNVGGGYATDRLSDVTLDFLLQEISSGYAWSEAQTPGDESWGLYLNAVRKGCDTRVSAEPSEPVGPPPVVIDPNPLGTLRQSSGAMYEHSPRAMPAHAIIHDSVFERLSDAEYAPQSVFNLNRALDERRQAVGEEVRLLAKTGSVDDEMATTIQEKLEHLSLTRWSACQAAVGRPAFFAESSDLNGTPSVMA